MLLVIAGLAIVGGLIAGAALQGKGAKVAAMGLAAVVAGASILFATMYTQDEGEAMVMKNFDGRVVGQDTDPGLEFKAPWVDAIDFDIRNQQAIYKGEGTGEGENGPQITVQDKDKVTANVDIAIRYSIVEDKVTDIYKQYQSQSNFVSRLIDQDMKSVVRNTFSGYTTAQVLESRQAIELKVSDELKKRWEGKGVKVESIALQDIRYPAETQAGFRNAQESVTNLKKAQADLKVAEAQAKSNKVISDSLTPELLQKDANETLREVGKHGNVIITDGGGNVMLNVDTPEKK